MEIFSFHRPDGEGDAQDDDGDEDSIMCMLACLDLVIIEMMSLIRSPSPSSNKGFQVPYISFRLPSLVDDFRLDPYCDDEMIIIFIHE